MIDGKDPEWLYSNRELFPAQAQADLEARALEAQIIEAVNALLIISKDSTRMSKLHEIEQMMVNDVIAEPRHMKCQGCLKWMLRLIEKANSTTPQ